MKPITAKPITGDTPLGTPVYVVEDGEAGVTLTVTRSEVWDLCGTKVVKVAGCSGGYAIERCFDARESLWWCPQPVMEMFRKAAGEGVVDDSFCGHQCETGPDDPCILGPDHKESHRDKNGATWARKIPRVGLWKP